MKELEYKIKNAKQLKEKEMKAAEAEVKNCKKDVDAAKKQWGAKEAEEAALTMEIAELKKAIEEGKINLHNYFNLHVCPSLRRRRRPVRPTFEFPIPAGV